MEQLSGYVEKIVFQNPETGYTIAQLKVPNQSNPVCVVGIMPMVCPGETVRCTGHWKNHLIHGRQFCLTECRIEAPADVIGIKKYLGSGLIKGIGTTYASRIVQKFGADTLNIIDQSPEKLLEIEGLGPKRLEKITTCWSDQKSIRDVMVFLQSHGVSPAYAQKIFKKYGAQSNAKVLENPYRLARDITGIGFKTADVIAQKLGYAQNSPQRIDAGIEYVLYEMSNEGHVCYHRDEFIAESVKILEVDALAVAERLDCLHKENRIEIFNLMYAGNPQAFVWIRSLFESETGIARELMRIKKAASRLRNIDVEKALQWVQEKLQIKLAEQQQAAVSQAVKDKVLVITGGPGTGKSTITKAILSITEKLTDKIILAAPTGRAAKRMSEITGKKASTIHSLLEFDFKNGKFKRNRDSPLDCDLIIIDEASMIDTYLMYAVLRAIPSHARLILVGDINQLPSVGPGNVLKDIINSRSIAVNTLTEIFRQAAGSRIVTNAHLINRGTFPDIKNHSSSDFFFMEKPTSEEVLSTILALVSERLPKKFGFNPIRDIQVLAPMKKGIIGTENLNIALQEILNPGKNPIQFAGRRFLIGDKVMQLRNDYQREVFNGDIGRIIDIDSSEQQLLVEIDGKQVKYDFRDLDELALSYAVSIHKYQGSECPCVVIPVHTSHFKLLTRNLLYTAVTRGKKLVVLVGTTKALAIAVHNNEVQKRYTGLQQALIGSIAGVEF